MPSPFSDKLKQTFKAALGLYNPYVEWLAWAQAVIDEVAALEASPRYALTWGATLATPGNFPVANGTAGATEVAAADPTSQLPAPMAGTLTTLVWHSAAADATTDVKVFVGGVEQGTIDLDGASGSASLAGLTSTAVAVGDLIHLEFDAGTAPGASVWAVSIE